MDSEFRPDQRNRSEITVPFLSNPPVSNLTYDVTDNLGMSVKDNASMHIVNMTVELEVHGVVARIPGQAFTWTLPREFGLSAFNRPFTLTVWNVYGATNYSFLQRTGHNYSLTGIWELNQFSLYEIFTYTSHMSMLLHLAINYKSTFFPHNIIDMNVWVNPYKIQTLLF